MKVKAISRSLSDHQPVGSEAPKMSRNLDPALHPFERGREYIRALNAVKLERLFAAPFLCQLGQGHVDGVYCMAKDPKSLERVASGSGDGIIKVWDLPGKDQVWQTRAHENIVKGVAWTRDQKLLSCAADRSIKLYDPYNTPDGSAPTAHWLTDHTCHSISHHRTQNSFAVATNAVSIYDLERPSAAAEVLKWPTSADTITALAFNQVETSILASCATDRSLVFYDLRTSMPLAKTVMTFASNAIAWNPQEAFIFALASENHDATVFDMRKMDRATNVLKGHVAAVMDVEWSPTGEELVTGSWDRTIRLWHKDRGHCRDTYHTKRMQRVFCAQWTPDSKYILTGSDDGNVRLWRAQASARSGVKTIRERQAREANDALIKRYEHTPEVRRIKRHRHLPKVIKKAGEIKGEELQAIKRREENLRKHSKKKFEQRRSEREKMILAREQ